MSKEVRINYNEEDKFAIRGTEYRPVTEEPNGWLVERLSDGLKESFTTERLRKLENSSHYRYFERYFSEDKSFVRLTSGAESLATLGDDERDDCLWKEDCVTVLYDFIGQKKVKLTEESINARLNELEEAAKARVLRRSGIVPNPSRKARGKRKSEMPDLGVFPGARTLLGWRRVYARAQCNPLAFRPQYRKCGNRQGRFSADAKSLLAVAVLSYGAPGVSLAKVKENVDTAFRKRNAERQAANLAELEVPGMKAIRAAVQKLDPYWVTSMREGVAVANMKFAWVTRGLQITMPGHRIELDECEIDFVSLAVSSAIWEFLSPEERAKVQRIRRWCSIAVDCATRVILGLRISATPTKEGALATLEMVTRDKGEFADAAGAKSSWHQACKPKVVVSDWGAPYASNRYRTSVADIGAAALFPPAGWPGARGTIESVARMAAVNIGKRMHAKTFSNVLQRGEHPSEDLAGLTDDEVAYVFIRMIVDAYHNTPHAGLGGQTPYNAWDAAVASVGAPPSMDRHNRRCSFGQIAHRVVGNQGIRYLGNFYTSEELGRWFTGTWKGHREVEIRVDLQNLGAIAVLINGEFIDVPCRDEFMEGRSAVDWIQTMAALQAANHKAYQMTAHVVHAALEDVERLNNGSLGRANISSYLPSEEQIEQAEEALFAQYEFREESDELPPAGVLGDVIAPIALATALQRTSTAMHADRLEKNKPAKKAKAFPSSDNSDAWGVSK